MPTITIEEKVTIEVVTCCSCGILFGMTADLLKRRRSDGNWFYCPNGHHQHFAKTDAERAKELQSQLDQQKIKLSQAEAAARQAVWEKNVAESYRIDAENSLRATKGVVTKLKKRMGNGVCPVEGCRRHFNNVDAHIRKQHPEWKAEP